MSLSGEIEVLRPAIEPIRTSYADLPNRPRLHERQKPSPLAAIVLQGEGQSLSDAFESDNSREDDQQYLERALGRLRIPSCSPGTTGLTTPSGTRWTVARQTNTTPVSASPACSIPPIVEAQGVRSRYRCETFFKAYTSVPDGAKHYPLSPLLSSERRKSTPCCRSSIQRVEFQQHQAELWKKGARNFGNVEGADVFVRPVQLPRRPGEGKGSQSGDSTSPLWLPNSRLVVRAIIHSKERVSIGLKREFDLDTLRSTIPDPLPSPRSPNFDRESLLSALNNSHCWEKQNPAPNLIEGSRLSAKSILQAKSVGRSPSSDGRHGPRTVAVPIHIQYARAQLPALAAILLSELVRRGDTIDLPVPHPRAWSETVAYVYTGEEELLTEQVKENVLHLGGKIQ